METDDWLLKVNPKFVELLERLVIALEQTQMPTRQEWQVEKSRVQEDVPKGLLPLTRQPSVLESVNTPCEGGLAVGGSFM